MYHSNIIVEYEKVLNQHQEHSCNVYLRYSIAMNRAVIVCGAKIKDYEFVSSFFSEGDFFIYCDSGLIHEDRFLSKSDTKAGLIIGDFDSHQRPERDVEIIELPTVKDDTDSIYAIKEAISGCQDFEIVETTDIFDDLAADSLDMVELMMIIEEVFGIDIKDSEVDGIRTVKDLIALVEKKKL